MLRKQQLLCPLPSCSQDCDLLRSVSLVLCPLMQEDALFFILVALDKTVGEYLQTTLCYSEEIIL